MLPPQDSQDIELLHGQVFSLEYFLGAGAQYIIGIKKVDEQLLMHITEGVLLDFVLESHGCMTMYAGCHA